MRGRRSEPRLSKTELQPAITLADAPRVSTSVRPSRPVRPANPDTGSQRRAKIEDEANTNHGEVAATGSQGCQMLPMLRQAPDARDEEAWGATTPRLVPARAWIQAMRVSQMRSRLRF